MIATFDEFMGINAYNLTPMFETMQRELIGYELCDMELLYIYIIDDHKNIKDCEFNFSPNYRFSLDRDNKTFRMERREELPAKWFSPNMRNVTAIIGKNGAGKSNLIECMLRTLCYQGGGIVIFEDNGDLWVNLPLFYGRHNGEYSFDFECKKMNCWGSPLKKEAKCVDDAHVVYYSPNIDRVMERSRKSFCHYSDISNAALLRYEVHDIGGADKLSLLTGVESMFCADLYRILLFFDYTEKFGYKIPLDIRIPRYINVTLIVHNRIDDAENANDTRFAKHLRSMIVAQMREIGARDKNELPKIYRLLVDAEQKGYVVLPSQQHTIGGQKHLEFKLKMEGINEELINSLYRYMYPNSIPYASYGSIEMDKGRTNSLVKLEWDGMSSGELAILTFFARLFGIVFSKQTEVHMSLTDQNSPSNHFDGKTMLVFLDEPDLMLHPEWQQKFLKILLEGLESIFPKVFFQIIITSHSPIILSDLPKSNVIFIRKDEDNKCTIDDASKHKETFCANIHTLFNDSFFLDGIPIGTFAKSKVEQLFNSIYNDDAKCTAEMIADIYRIGEPLLRNALLCKIKEKKDSLEKSVRIKVLEMELEELKSQRDD